MKLVALKVPNTKEIITSCCEEEDEKQTRTEQKNKLTSE